MRCDFIRPVCRRTRFFFFFESVVKTVMYTVSILGGAFAKLRRATVVTLVCLSFCMEQLDSLGRIFVKFDGGALLRQNMVLVEMRQK